MKDNIHAGHRDRLRNLAAKNNFKNLEQHQLLELLLSYVIPRKDTNPIAHNLIKQFGSFAGVLDADVNSLEKVNGIGNKTANFLSSLKHVFYEYVKTKGKETVLIRNTFDAVSHIKSFLDHKTIEEFYVVCIDNSNKVKLTELISSGTNNKINIDVRKITEVVFKSNTGNVIICHNHPSGNVEPSLADDKLTKSVLTALSINGINLLDHIIVTDNEYYSYSSMGVLSKYLSEIKELVGSARAMEKICEYNKTNK